MIKTILNLKRIRGHTILTLGLNKQSIVIDGGSHRGEFSNIIQRLFGSECVLIEANPTLAADLVPPANSHMIHAALSSSDGYSEFYFRPNAECGGILSLQSDNSYKTTKIPKVSLLSLFERYKFAKIDLLKLDIEGEEFELLRKASDDTLNTIKQITVEFHDFLPTFSQNNLYFDIKRRLTKLGFYCFQMSIRTHGDVLFVNSNLNPMSLGERIAVRVLGKFVIRLAKWNL